MEKADIKPKLFPEVARLGLFWCKISPDAIRSHNGPVCARRDASSWKSISYLAGHMTTMKQDFQLELLNYLDFKKKKNKPKPIFGRNGVKT